MSQIDDDQAVRHEGPAYEAGKSYKISAVVVSVQGDLYGLEALTEPVVQEVDTADEPAALPDPLECRD